MVTETDLQIITLLQGNGRLSYAEIADSVGITSTTAAKRIKYLIKSDIMSVRAMLNPYELGLRAGAFIGAKVAIDKQGDIHNQLIRNNFVTTILSTIGDFDLLFIVRDLSWDRLNQFITDQLAFMDGVIDFDCRYIKETVKRYHHIFGDGKSYKDAPEIKQLDWDIIEHLCQDGRISNSELSKKLGNHVSTISRRVNFLTEHDFIRIQSQPNPTKFGYVSSIIVTTHVDMAKCDEICRVLSQYDEIFLILKTINRPHIIIGMHAKNNEEIVDLINEKIQTISGIKQVEVFFRSKVIKSSYGWYVDKML